MTCGYRAAYPPELRRHVEFHRAGHFLCHSVEALEPSRDIIADWARQADADAGKRPDLPGPAARGTCGATRVRVELREKVPPPPRGLLEPDKNII